jgi:hypothetical protein
MTSLSFRVISVSRETSSIKSALVISHAPYREPGQVYQHIGYSQIAETLASTSFDGLIEIFIPGLGSCGLK